MIISLNILLSTFFIIIGAYTLMLNTTSQKYVNVSNAHGYQVQAEEIAKSGIHLIVRRLGSDTTKPNPLPQISNMSLQGGVLNCITTDLSDNRVRVQSIGLFNDFTVTKIVDLRLVKVARGVRGKKKKWARWVTENVYTTQEASEFAKW